LRIELICPVCGKTFYRRRAEHNRSVKLGREEYCSLTCGGIANQDDLGSHKGKGKPAWLVAGNRLDEFSSFRYYVNKARQRKNKGPSDLTVEFLKELWERQKGKCPYTGLDMHLPKTTRAMHLKANIATASLDRIDSSKGYTTDNVEFVCLGVNFLKRDFSPEVVVTTLKTIADNISKGLVLRCS